MPLSSNLFKGDAALEAASNTDSAHITLGARGPHVGKIQTALNILDDAKLVIDSIYGPATAKAVQNYKDKRAIVNRSYQASADNIVGIMTMARLDEEMKAYETKPSLPFRLIPISPRANAQKAYPRLNFKITESGTLLPFHSNSILPDEAITLDPMRTAEIEVQNGDGAMLRLGSATFEGTPLASLFVPGVKDPVNSHILSGVGPAITLKVRAGTKWGTAVLFASKVLNGTFVTERLLINIRDQRANIFHPTDAHHHEPVPEQDWDKVCDEAGKDPTLGFWLTRLARNKASPETVTTAAPIALFFSSMALWHYRYYMDGFGGVVNEDENLRDWIEGDSDARTIIAKRIREKRRGNESNVSVMFTFSQKSFGDGDARQSFGTIDNLEARADFVLGIVEVWFEDTYEWHPPYSQYTKPKRCSDAVDRDTNFLHAACVQMKNKGAKDYQMRGRWTFLMKIFPGL